MSNSSFVNGAAMTMGDLTLDTGTNGEEDAEAKGFLHAAFRKWCLEQPDLIVAIGDGKVTDIREQLKLVAPTVTNLFADFLRDNDNGGGKDAETAQRLKEEGNENYKAKRFGQAIGSYTRSAQAAPARSEVLAVAYANRSAVFFQAKEYHKTLRDVERALPSGYPSATSYRLVERRTKCFLHLKEHEKMSASLKEFLSCLEVSELSKANKTTVVAEMQKLIQANIKQESAAPENKGNAASQQPSEQTTALLLPKLPQPNPDFPAFSKCISIAYSDARGRQGRAARDINAGELVAVEEPVVSYLERSVIGQFCTHCCKPVNEEEDDGLPSPFTSKDLFCSSACLNSAVNSYHGVEHRISSHLLNCGLVKSEWFLALRAVTQKPLSFFLAEKKGKFKVHNPKYGVDGLDSSSSPPYTAEDYGTLFNLVTMHERWDPALQLFKAFVTCFFLALLKWAKYFQSSDGWSGRLTEEEIYVGQLLSHFMEVCTMNSHEIGHYQASYNVGGSDNAATSSWYSGSTKPIGSSLEPTLVLLNHSCDPNIIRINVGRSTVFFAARDIKEDEEITDCYLPLGFKVPKSSRQAELGKYHFACTCQVCTEDWPISSHLPRGLQDVDPSKFKSGLLDDVRRMQSQFGRIQKLGAAINQEQRKDNVRGCLATSLEFLRVLEETLARPHQFYVMAARTIIQSLWIIHGSKSKRRDDGNE